MRLPGQYYDQETGLHYNYFRYYDPATGRYLTADPIGQDAGPNLYSYVGNNPLFWIDPLGLDVQICGAPAQILGGLVDHQWIKTDTKEAGAQGPEDNAGDQFEAPYITDLFITDHSGDSQNREGASCEAVKSVDEDKVNELLDIGKGLGKFSSFNHCQSFVRDVIRQSRITKQTRRGRRPAR